MVDRRSFNPAFSGRRKTPPSCGRRNQTRQHERIIINAILETSQKPRGRIPSPKCTHAQILKSQILGKARVRQKAKKRKREDAICITWCSCVTDLEGIFLNAKAAFLPCVSATLFLFRDERHQKKFTADTRNNAFFSARTLHWRIFFPNHNATRWIRYPAQKSGFLLLKKQFLNILLLDTSAFSHRPHSKTQASSHWALAILRRLLILTMRGAQCAKRPALNTSGRPYQNQKSIKEHHMAKAKKKVVAKKPVAKKKVVAKKKK